MKFAGLLLIGLVVLSLGAMNARPAVATTVDDCQADLATLRADTIDAQASFTNQNDVDRLVAKLDAASAKLAAGKNADAVQKLDDFQTKLEALATAPKPKVDPAVAEALGVQAQEVVACINAIGT